jgi:hypothetical protein
VAANRGEEESNSQSTKPKRLYKFHISKTSKKKTEAVNNTCQSIIDVVFPKMHNDFPKNKNLKHPKNSTN